MTEKLTCPNCGSEAVEQVDNEDCKLCSDCICLWNESRRKLAITPEMAYVWFCRTIFKSMPYVESIRISANNYLDFYFNESVQQWQRGGLYVHSNIVEALDWQDMPPMTRKNGE